MYVRRRKQGIVRMCGNESGGRVKEKRREWNGTSGVSIELGIYLYPDGLMAQRRGTEREREREMWE